MNDSDSGSAGSAAHAPKTRNGQDGQVAKLRNQFEPPMSQAPGMVPARRSACVASAGQLQTAGKRYRSSVQPADSAAPAASSAAGPPADHPALTLAGLLARIKALEQDKTDVQQLSSDLLQTQNELAAVRSDLLQTQTDLTEFRGSVDKQLGEQTSHSIARETAAKDKLQQQVNAEGSSLEHLSQRVSANNPSVLHGVPDLAAYTRLADLTRYVSNKLDAAAPRRGPSSPALSQSIQPAVSHIGRLASGKRAVLVQFSTHTAKHEAFKLSPHLRRSAFTLLMSSHPNSWKRRRAVTFVIQYYDSWDTHGQTFPTQHSGSDGLAHKGLGFDPWFVTRAWRQIFLPSS